MPKLPSKYIIPIYSCTNSTNVFLFLAPIPVPKQHWVSWNLKVNDNLRGENNTSLFIFCISFLLNESMHPFICLSSIYVSHFSLYRWPDSWPFAHFSLELPFPYWCLSSLCLLRELALYVSKYLFAFFLEQRCQFCLPHGALLSLG